MLVTERLPARLLVPVPRVRSKSRSTPRSIIEELRTRPVAVAYAPRSTAPGADCWTGVLPDFEASLCDEIQAFRRSMRAHHVAPDYRSDTDLRRRAGAWTIYRDVRFDYHGTAFEFSLYVRRARNQFAVWEGGGAPDSLRANFSRSFPGSPPTPESVSGMMSSTLERCRGGA